MYVLEATTTCVCGSHGKEDNMDFIIVIVIFVSFLGLGLSVEKLKHNDYTLFQVSRQLKNDIKIIIKGLFGHEVVVVRHVYDPQIDEELRKVARPYSNSAFGIEVVKRIHYKTPFIGISFVPAHEMNEEELNEVTKLLLLKFRQYLGVHNLRWKNFSSFNSGELYVNIFLYYAELPEDRANFLKRYQMILREKAELNYGLLEDDSLNKELKNVD